MAFPTSPTDGQTAIVNSVTYQYANSTNAWTRILSTANIITANTIAVNGNISAAGNVSGTYVAGTLTTADQPNITNLGNLISLTVSNSSGTVNFQDTANVTLGGVSNLHISGGTANYVLSTNGSGSLSWTPQPAALTVVVDDFTGDGSTTVYTLSVTPGSIDDTTVNYNGAILLRTSYSLSVANIIFSSPPENGSEIEVTTIGGSYGGGGGTPGGSNTQVQFNDDTVFGGSAAFTFNKVSNILSVSGNVVSGNFLTSGLISAVGNVTGLYIFGNGSQLTGLPATYGNANVVANLAALGSNPVSTTGNITSGNLLTSGLISATGNVAGNFFIGNGSQLTGVAASSVDAAALIGNTLSSNVLFSSLTSVGNLGNLTVTGNTTSGSISATGNINGGNVIVNSGNLTGANVISATTLSATGNVTGGNINTNSIVGTGLTITSTGALNLVPTGNVTVNSRNINNVAEPAQDSDAATKFYVDSVAQGLNIHDAASAATTTTLDTATGGTITYNNGASGVGATLTTTGLFNLIDTVNVQSSGTRILVKNEANAVTNGVYVWSNATVITRATDYNSVPEVEAGDFIFVLNGNTYGNTGWVQVSTVTGIGTAGNNITFTQFSGVGAYTGNTSAGISVNGTVINAKVDNTTTAFDGSGNIVVKTSANLTTPNIGAATGTSLSTTGNITGGNILTGGLLSVAGNILISGVFSVAGNVTANNGMFTNIVNAASHTGAVVSVTGNVTGGNITGTITSSRINPRVFSTASTASLTPDVSSFDQYNLTALAADVTINAPTGTPVNGNKIMFRILDNGVSRTITWNATYTVIGVSLPAATTAGKRTYVGCIYNTENTCWDVVAVTTQT